MFATAGDVIFRRVAGGYEPTDFARGPWSADHLHGGAVAGLIAHASEAVPAPVPMRATRLSIDILHPVPMSPIVVKTFVRREGKRLQLLDVSVRDGDREVVRASVLRIREAKDATSSVVSREPGQSDWDGPDMRFAIPEDHAAQIPGFIRALDYVRPPDDSGDGPVRIWIRLRCALVEGVTPTPFVRAALAADFTSGTGSRLDYTKWRFINPDVTAYFERMPEGEWLRVEASSRFTPDGIGWSAAVLGDEAGVIGHGQVSVFVEPNG